MRLDNILKSITYADIKNYKNVMVRTLSHNSKECKNGSMYFAINGVNTNGNNYIDEAIKNGAVVVVTEDKNVVCDTPIIVVENVRISMCEISKIFYESAVDTLKIVGIIGTAGKTTTSMIVSHILSYNDNKCAVIGTNGIYVMGERFDNSLTTPDPIEMHKMFLYIKNKGVEYVIMEVSAQSIYLHKMHGVYIDIGVFTNVSNEHLDYFKTMSNYIKVKTSIFTDSSMRECVINIDDSVGLDMTHLLTIPYTTIGKNDMAMCKIKSITRSGRKTSVVIEYSSQSYTIATSLLGEHNVYNIVSAIMVAVRCGLDITHVIDSITSIEHIPGRCEMYKIGGKDIVIDFAHTPDSMDSILSTIADYCHKPIITIFGAVGYSDSEKRKLMGEVVSKYSHKIIITSDNPGNTSFVEICHDIMQGISGVDVECIEDRASAIKHGYATMLDEVLVILGKGHETFQKIGDERVAYSDKEVVMSLGADE